MKIVQGDEQPIHESRTVRDGDLKKRYLLNGEDGPGNFSFAVAYQIGDFYSPRHHHNFDQWRFQIEGDCGFDKAGKMKPGVIGYFPEGAYYGPQTSNQPNVVAVVQFGGPSGYGYLGWDELNAASAAMKSFGRFEKGVYYRKEGVEGKKAMDSFQATWEFAKKRSMVYPKPQYSEPILMNPGHYRWIPLDGESGVEEKAYGTFTDCKIRCASYKLDPGASFQATGRGIYFVLSGRGLVEREPFRQLTSVYVNSNESARFQAEETSEILLLGLPEVGRMRRQMPGFDAVEQNASTA